MKCLNLILFNILITTSLFSQNTDSLKDKDTLLLFQKKTYPAFNNYDQKIQFHLSTGASVISFGNSSVFTQWIAPGFTYQVSPKLNLHFGSMVLNGNSNSQFFNNEQPTLEKRNSTQAFIYISGDYQLNKSIRFRATTFHEMKGKNSNQNSYSYNQLGVDIKVTDNFFISADFINENGQRPFGMYNNSMFNDCNNSFGGGFINNGHLNTFR